MLVSPVVYIQTSVVVAMVKEKKSTSAGGSIVPGRSSPRAIGVAVAVRELPWSVVVWTTALFDQPPSPSLLTARTCTAYAVLSRSPETTYESESEPEVHTSSSTVQLALAGVVASPSMYCRS